MSFFLSNYLYWIYIYLSCGSIQQGSGFRLWVSASRTWSQGDDLVQLMFQELDFCRLPSIHIECIKRGDIGWYWMILRLFVLSFQAHGVAETWLKLHISPVHPCFPTTCLQLILICIPQASVDANMLAGTQWQVSALHVKGIVCPRIEYCNCICVSVYKWVYFIPLSFILDFVLPSLKSH